MKILQITPAYKPAYIYGGPTMSVAKLCEAIVKQGDGQLTLEVLTTTANGPDELAVLIGEPTTVDGVWVTYFKRVTKDHTHFSPDLLLALRKKISSSETIIHIHSWWNLVAIFSCLIAKVYNVPVVLSPRGMLTSYTQNNRNSFFKSTLHRLIGKSLLKYCHIIASSDQERQDILQIIKPKSIHILPNLVNLPFEAKAETTTVSTNFRLLFLSRVEAKKGLDILFESLVDFIEDWSLNIGGNGDDDYIKSLKAKAESLEIASRINWLGLINNEDKFQLLANHDLLVLTSHNENFANVVIESLSVGTPVLISNNVGLSDYVKANDLGFISELAPAEITAALYQAHADVIKRDRIRLAAIQIIKNDFSEDKLAQRYLDHYQDILTVQTS